MNVDWSDEFPGAITVCDTEGVIVYMNDRSAKMFAEQGGRRLVGGSLFDCHPEKAHAKLRQMLRNRERNVYTIEKNGVRKLLYQSPWYRDGEFAGLVELGLEIPVEMPHFVRAAESAIEAIGIKKS